MKLCTWCDQPAVKRIDKGVRACQSHFIEFKKLQRERNTTQRHKRLESHPYLRRAFTKYGISPQEYLQLIHKQRGHCPICWRRFSMPRTGKKRGAVLVVDHDHKTGRVRGLICGKCNTAIGLLADDVQRLDRAIAYLQGLTKNWERDTLSTSVSSEAVPPTVM